MKDRVIVKGHETKSRVCLYHSKRIVQWSRVNIKADGELGNLKLDGNGKKGSDRVEILLLGQHAIKNTLQHQQFVESLAELSEPIWI